MLKQIKRFYSCDGMKEKWENLLIALIIAVIVTGVWVVSIYCNILIPTKEVYEEMESTGFTGSSPNLPDSLIEPYSGFFIQITVFLIVVFCITTVLSYIVIERLRKKKNNRYHN